MKIAIEKGNYDEFVMYFEKKKVKILDYEEDTGNNPLHLTVKANSQLQGLEKEDKNFDGDSALMLAVLYCDIKMVKLLVEVGDIDVNCKESEGFTPFMAACANGKVDIVEYLMNNTICNIYSKNQYGQTAIHRAAFYGEINIIKLLKEKSKLSLSSRDSRGNTCLHFAAMRFNMSCFRYILKRLGDSNELELKKKNQEGLTPVQILIKTFNMIKKDDRVVTEQEMINFIHDKNKPPQNLYDSIKELKPNLFIKMDPSKEQQMTRPGNQPENQEHQTSSKKNIQAQETFQDIQNLNESITQIQQAVKNQYKSKEYIEHDQSEQNYFSTLKPLAFNPENTNQLLISPKSSPRQSKSEIKNVDLEMKNLFQRRKVSNTINMINASNIKKNI